MTLLLKIRVQGGMTVFLACSIKGSSTMWLLMRGHALLLLSNLKCSPVLSRHHLLPISISNKVYLNSLIRPSSILLHTKSFIIIIIIIIWKNNPLVWFTQSFQAIQCGRTAIQICEHRRFWCSERTYNLGSRGSHFILFVCIQPTNLLPHSADGILTTNLNLNLNLSLKCDHKKNSNAMQHSTQSLQAHAEFPPPPPTHVLTLT